ncbi:hypothetical protein DFA_07225 [Cavenderia fasciculata]|uniref:DUF4460 domain-containing protein n=1 Tax=Cavenderia fasciculata TaxID=261658 RepID=F4PVU4_CACFS|nr:uncharacterized protein DFA_07225 [Cavenderia fasciculata]EGG20108.1 hypothetical protein DFA_07225 [Cavenderia fasciculata]|eukprot:XP_004367091.1 hypothetical protein DFA_07225 [Cavenderia fasciculata]
MQMTTMMMMMRSSTTRTLSIVSNHYGWYHQRLMTFSYSGTYTSRSNTTILSSSSSRFIYNNQNISKQQQQQQPLCICNNNYNRLFCTSSSSSSEEKKNTSKIKAIRSTLKKFFLKVHPDLFYQYPDVKKTNDKSLRILQSFLEEIKNEKMTTRSYSLQFYYLDSESAGATEQSQIPHISVSFDIDSSNPRKLQTFLRNAEKQLQYLLRKIGIKDDFILNYLNDKESNETFEPSDSLIAFIRDNSHAARELAKIKVDLDRSLDIMFTYFFMEHKIRVLFSEPQDHGGTKGGGGGGASDKTEMKKQTLRQLEHILHTLSPRIADDHLVHKIFHQDRIAEMEKIFKKQSIRYGEDDDDDEEYQDEESRLKILEQYRQRKQQEKEELAHQQTMHKSGFGYHKNSWKGWDKIKAGFVTPETTEKSDDCHISLRLEGMTILFTYNGSSGVDLEGRLMLDIEKPGEWSQLLESVKPSLVVNNIKKCRKRKELEREVSELFGVGFVYTDYSQQNNPTYLEYLEKIKQTPKEQFIGRTTVYQDINIRIILKDEKNNQKQQSVDDDDNDDDDGQEDQIHGSFTSDEKHGVLNIPIDSRVEHICKFIDSEANFLIREYQRHQNNIRNLNQLELTVKRQFRLMKLSKHSDIAHIDMVSCCRRLLNNQESFLPFLFNVKVVIGKENAISQDGQITIKWDFEL